MDNDDVNTITLLLQEMMYKNTLFAANDILVKQVVYNLCIKDCISKIKDYKDGNIALDHITYLKGVNNGK